MHQESNRDSLNAVTGNIYYIYLVPNTDVPDNHRTMKTQGTLRRTRA